VLFEYTIKFEKDGLTLTQRVESGVDAPVDPSQSPLDQKLLPSRSPASEMANPPAVPPANGMTGHIGGAPVERPKGLGGNPGSFGSGVPVTIIGPFILLQPQPRIATKSEGEV
jgi:hypothetical protein